MPCRSYSTGQADPAVALLSPLSVEEVVGEEVEMVAATTMGVATFHALPRAKADILADLATVGGTGVIVQVEAAGAVAAGIAATQTHPLTLTLCVKVFKV